MKLSNKKIKEIAENLDCGMACYVNKQTREVKLIIDPDDIFADEEYWRDDLDEIEKNWGFYIKISKMPSRESFQVMEDFTNQVSNKDIRNRLIYALNRNKPFKNFKYEVDYNEDIRQQWFKFKSYKYEEWVKDCLENITIEDESKEDIDKQLPKIMGYYNDEGSEFNPNLFPLPNLCVSCKKHEDSKEEVICNLTRMDQLEETEFKCHAYEAVKI